MSNMCTSCFADLKWHQVTPYPEKPYHPYHVGECGCGGNVVEMDELILPTIQVLNKKGWTTKYCCSGHMNEGYIHTYIYFENVPPKLPFNFEVRGNPDTAIYYKKPHRDLRGLDGYEKLLQINRSLYKWALNLPERVEVDERNN